MKTVDQTLGNELTKANPQTIADALRQVDLGNLLQAKRTGEITQSSSATLTGRTRI